MEDFVCESKVIEAIKTFLLSNFNSKVSPTHKVSQTEASANVDEDTKRVRIPWIKCIRSFLPLMQSLSPPSLLLSYCDVCVIHRGTSSTQYHPKKDYAAWAEAIKNSELLYQYDTDVAMHYELHGFSTVGEINSFIKAKRLSPRESVTSKNSEEVVTLAGIQKQFKLIGSLFEIETFSILGRFKDTYLENMLDIQSPNICALLPYLLTSYVFNYKSNHFIQSGINAELAFDEDNVPTCEASRIRTQLELLSKRFQLPKKINKWKENIVSVPLVDASHDLSPGNAHTALQVWLPADCHNPWESLPLLWRVFVAWCGIFICLETNACGVSDFPIPFLPHPINFKASLELFSLHTGSVQTFSSDVSIAQHLANTFSDFFPDWPEILGADGQTGT